MPNILYNTQTTSLVDVTLVHHLLGLEDILIMHAVDALGYVNAMKFINATTTTILILIDGVLFKFIFKSTIRVVLLQPLAKLCIPCCSDLAIELFRIEQRGGPGLDLVLAQPSS